MNLAKICFLVSAVCSLMSCSVNNDESASVGTHENKKSTKSQVDTNPNGDFDGDGISNANEKTLGRNPFVADLPVLKTRFLQNFFIEGSVIDSDGNSLPFSMASSTSSNDPDFKYRVGKIFARSNSYRVAASFGRFSSHVVGEIAEHDLSWVKYPNLDPKFFHQTLLDSKKLLEEDKYPVSSFKVKLDNVIQLRANGLFRSISNLKINFYYFNYESDNYELLDSKIVERHFNSGINESFSVEIENLPKNLISDNLFKKGEFIISEIEDFDIPSMKTTYKKLLAQVRAKSIPVVLNTPLETTVKYVGLNGSKARFNDILSSLYESHFKIQENKLTKIGQFSNNLSGFTYLKEVRDKDKEGRWIVMTNPIDRNFLDHEYSSTDKIILSYVLGSELAGQKDEAIFSYREQVSGGDEYNTYILGNVSPNSRIDIQILPKRRYGHNLTRKRERLDLKQGSCGRNCTSGRDILCNWEVNILNPYDEKLVLNKSFDGDTSKLSLIINDEIFSVKKLVEEKLIETYWAKSKEGSENLHILIKDISKIKDIVNYEDNLLSLKVETFSDYVFWGAKLTKAERQHAGGPGGCAWLTALVANKYESSYISMDSIRFSEIENIYHKYLKPEIKKKIKFRNSSDYYQRIDLGVSSTIFNYFN